MQISLCTDRNVPQWWVSPSKHSYNFQKLTTHLNWMQPKTTPKIEQLLSPPNLPTHNTNICKHYPPQLSKSGWNEVHICPINAFKLDLCWPPGPVVASKLQGGPSFMSNYKGDSVSGLFNGGLRNSSNGDGDFITLLGNSQGGMCHLCVIQGGTSLSFVCNSRGGACVVCG